MIRRAIVAAVLCASASVSAWQALPSPLADAERSLADALARHDRAAFVALLAPDASFFLPVPTHGADAVVASWLPFLLNDANTMTLTPGNHVVAASGDLAYVTGTFAISAAGNGPVRAATGEYVAIWRVVEGHWKLSTVGGVATPSATPAGGVGGYRFGMTPDAVRSVSECQPYTNVSQTGGLECANYTFDGRRMNVSFVFTAGRLRRIQLWEYQGGSEADAKEAVSRVIEYLKRIAGGVVVGALPGVEITADRVMDMLGGAQLEPGRGIQFDLSTPATSKPETWFARVAKAQSPTQQTAYLVFLFADPRPGQ